jgi:Domain of unknown function (DUF3850)
MRTEYQLWHWPEGKVSGQRRGRYPTVEAAMTAADRPRENWTPGKPGTVGEHGWWIGLPDGDHTGRYQEWGVVAVQVPDKGEGERHGRGRVHELKCWPPYWDLINRGLTTCTIRKDDRGYRVRDILVLREWVPKDWQEDNTPGVFTGRVCERVVTNVLVGGKFGLTKGYVALSLAADQRRKTSR